jgi:hypothetical protein
LWWRLFRDSGLQIQSLDGGHQSFANPSQKTPRDTSSQFGRGTVRSVGRGVRRRAFRVRYADELAWGRASEADARRTC